jgi:hypothetical protein
MTPDAAYARTVTAITYKTVDRSYLVHTGMRLELGTRDMKKILIAFGLVWALLVGAAVGGIVVISSAHADCSSCK